MSNIYEITFIARQEIAEKDVEEITKSFISYVTENGGKELKTEYWGLRDFAYEIKKAKRGHYMHFVIEGNGAISKEIERKAKLHEDVLRCLVIRAEEFDAEQSALLNEKSEYNYKEARGA